MKTQHPQINLFRSKVASIAAAVSVGLLYLGIPALAETTVPSVEKTVAPASVKSPVPADPFADVPRPTGPFVADPKGGTVNGVAYDCILTNGSFTLTQTLKGRVLVTGNAVLYVPKTGRIQFAAKDRITIANGAKLSVYSDSSADAVFGNVANESGDAAKFNYFGLAPTANSEVAFRVEPRFCGTIFAPHQKLALIGNASEEKDFVGAVVAKEVTLRDATN